MSQPMDDHATLIQLTQTVKAGGCASKLAPGTLSAVLASLPPQQSENVLVGFDTSDDAGVYLIGPDSALVQTVDFFTPMVDDPYTYGRIAATNALSDIYAMGAVPHTALSIVCFPQDGNSEVLAAILRGGLSVMQKVKCAVIGGHSVRDSEMKFGYAITGLVHPDRVWRNDRARPGDVLVFTKAMGTGVITTAIKQGKASPAWIDNAIRSMTTLNEQAAEVLRRFGDCIHAVTDVTGFGLIGHAREMAFGSGVRLEFHTSELQFIEGALDAVQLGCIPAGLNANRDFAECIVRDASGLTMTEGERTLLFDPQTAGGLLVSIDPSCAMDAVGKLQNAGYSAARSIGTVTESSTPGVLLA